jgi:hypothetical protein
MKTFLSIALAILIAIFLVWLKRQQLWAATRDLGDGGIQKLFDDGSK